MFRGRLWILAVMVGSVVLLVGCFEPTAVPGVDVEKALAVAFGAATYQYEATIDFGIANPDADPIELSGVIRNESQLDITVSDVSVDTAEFTLDIASAPFTVAAGQTIEVSLAFAPYQSGPVAGVLEVLVDGSSVPFVLNLAGEGNYPPVASAAVHVSGAGTAAANGTYYRTAELQNGYPVYRLTGTDFRVYGADLDGVAWLVDIDFDTTDDHYSIFSSTPTAPNGVAPNDYFPGSSGTAPGPDVMGEIISSSGAVYSLPPGDMIAPNYIFSDADAHGEGVTLYQWYRSDAQFDPFSSYTAIPDETGASYTVTSSDDGYYLKVLVTPVATDGITDGEPVWFGPSPRVFVPAA